MALSAARRTRVSHTYSTHAFPVASGATIYAGSLVMLNSSGYAEPASASAGNKGCIGVAQTTVSNAGADGLLTVAVSECEALFDNDGVAAVAQSDAGSAVYASDDATIASADGGNYPAAGRVVGVEAATDALGEQVRVCVGMLFL